MNYELYGEIIFQPPNITKNQMEKQCKINVELMECTELFGLRYDIQFKNVFNMDFINDNT